MDGHQEHQTALGWAARDTSGVLSPFTFPLRTKKDDDITLKILFCGICHTDLSTVTNEWRNARYPVVPGHEIIGVVLEVGCNVQKFKVGDKIGVGYLSDSCLECDSCKQDLENYCRKQIRSFNSVGRDGSPVYGGFSNIMVIKEHFAVRIPENVPLEKMAPLLCAGITMYTPLKYFGLNEPGKHIGVVGLGGLGHIAVKFGKAFGMRVTVISSTPSKEKEALEKLGADAFLCSHDPQKMQGANGTMDGIIDTVSADHDVLPLVSLLKVYGKLILVGVVTKPLQLPVYTLMQGGKMVAASSSGGLKDTQEMIDFAAEHGITAEVEVITMDYVNTAMKRLEKGDVRYRFVIDVSNTAKF